MRYLIITFSVVLFLAMIFVFWKAPPCGGDYKLKLGGKEYFLFECKQAPPPKPISNRAGYLQQFSVTKDYAIRGQNDIRIMKVKVSEEDCARLCLTLDLPNFQCRSFDYIKPDSLCDLSSATRFDNGIDFYRNVKVDHYGKN